MNITILCVGKIKEKYFTQAIDEYKKRLGAYAKVNIVEVQDEKTDENASEHEENLLRSKEGEKLLKKIPDGAYVITLEIGGKKLSSEELSSKIERLGIEGKSNLFFVIGGSIGLGENVLARSDFRLSFSDMTFPHQLMRVILLEQIYRSFRIMRNEPYHK